MRFFVQNFIVGLCLSLMRQDFCHGGLSWRLWFFTSRFKLRILSQVMAIRVFNLGRFHSTFCFFDLIITFFSSIENLLVVFFLLFLRRGALRFISWCVIESVFSVTVQFTVHFLHFQFNHFFIFIWKWHCAIRYFVTTTVSLQFVESQWVLLYSATSKDSC